MQLLDVIVPGEPYHPHKHFIGVVKETEPVNAVDTFTNNTIPTDSVSPDTLATDTVNTLQGMVNGAGTGTGGDDSSMLLWTAIVVVGALALCFYFAYTYRRKLGILRR